MIIPLLSLRGMGLDIGLIHFFLVEGWGTGIGLFHFYVVELGIGIQFQISVLDNKKASQTHSYKKFLAHLAEGNVSFCHHLASVVR